MSWRSNTVKAPGPRISSRPPSSSTAIYVTILILLTARFWSRVLPVTLQISISIFYYTALWWRGLTALLSQCVSFSLIDVGRVSSAYIVFLFFHHLSRASAQVTLHTILLGVGRLIYTPHTLKHPKELGLDTHKAIKLALKFLADSVQYNYERVSTRHALEKTSFDSHHRDQAWATASNPSNPNRFFFLFVEGIHGALILGILFSLIDVGSTEETSLHQLEKKRDTLAQKSCKYPSPQSRNKKGCWGHGGFFKRTAPEPGCGEYSCFQCAPIGNYFVGVLYRMCMDFTYKLPSSLVVKA
eukprot:1161437-Pelagomonas_calceolata.AAC.5